MVEKRGVGARLRREREARVWTQADLEKRSGVKIVTISRIESGRSEPQFGTLRKLAAALGLEPRWLISGVGPKAAKPPADKGAGGEE